MYGEKPGEKLDQKPDEKLAKNFAVIWAETFAFYGGAMWRKSEIVAFSISWVRLHSHGIVYPFLTTTSKDNKECDCVHLRYQGAGGQEGAKMATEFIHACFCTGIT